MISLMIDSGALLALIDRRDQHHVAAAQFFHAQNAASYVVPETIFAETMTLTKARLGARAAITLGERMMQSRSFSLVVLSEVDRQHTWNIFTRYSDKAWSYVDCSVLAVARRLQITTVFAFDQHFDQMAELRRLPG